MTTPNETRIVIADDHPIFREGLKRLLESEAGFAVVGECADGQEAVAAVNELSPDILLLDVAMPNGGGLNVLKELGHSTCRVILLTAGIEARDVPTGDKAGSERSCLERRGDTPID